MTRARQLTVLSFGAGLLAATAFAHHSFNATYRLDQRVNLEGRITRLVISNPHSILELETRNPGGGVELWTIEMGAALALSRNGIGKDTLRTGDEVSLSVSPLKPGSSRRNGGLLRTLRRASDQFEWGFKPGEVPNEFASPVYCSLCAR